MAINTIFKICNRLIYWVLVTLFSLSSCLKTARKLLTIVLYHTPITMITKHRIAIVNDTKHRWCARDQSHWEAVYIIAKKSVVNTNLNSFFFFFFLFLLVFHLEAECENQKKEKKKTVVILIWKQPTSRCSNFWTWISMSFLQLYSHLSQSILIKSTSDRYVYLSAVLIHTSIKHLSNMFKWIVDYLFSSNRPIYTQSNVLMVITKRVRRIFFFSFLFVCLL